MQQAVDVSELCPEQSFGLPPAHVQNLLRELCEFWEGKHQFLETWDFSDLIKLGSTCEAMGSPCHLLPVPTILQRFLARNWDLYPWDGRCSCTGFAQWF